MTLQLEPHELCLVGIIVQSKSCWVACPTISTTVAEMSCAMLVMKAPLVSRASTCRPDQSPIRIPLIHLTLRIRKTDNIEPWQEFLLVVGLVDEVGLFCDPQ